MSPLFDQLLNNTQFIFADKSYLIRLHSHFFPSHSVDAIGSVGGSTRVY